MNLSHTVDEHPQFLPAGQIEKSFAGRKEGRIEKVDSFLGDARVQLVDLLFNVYLSLIV